MTTLILCWLVAISLGAGVVIGFCWGRDVGRHEEPDTIAELLRRERSAR